jgi:hypothetical protein
MGNFDKFVNPREPSPYEKIIVNPIEKDKKERQEPYTGLKGTTRPQVFATLLSYFKKVLSTLSFKGKEGLIFLDEEHLLEHVRAFRELLMILSTEDQSHNPNYTQQLSTLWHNLLDDCNSLSASSATLDKIRFFITQIQNYPPGADHSLGYYFTEYAGKEWIPFPFMELLQHLHDQNKADREHSILSNWVALLTDILGK